MTIERCARAGYSCKGGAGGVYDIRCPEHGPKRPGQTTVTTAYYCNSGCGRSVGMAAQQCSHCRALDLLSTGDGAAHYDSGKPRMELLPPDVLVLVARVFAFGARKYADWNWTKGMDWSRLYGSTQRHLNAWSGGESLDPESGLPHLAHALCCTMMLAAHELRGLGHDDRHVIQHHAPVAPEARAPSTD